MPIMEFEGNLSWGYNPSFYFAPDKYYGTKDKLKEFIDVCHENGIAVILDIAMNDAFGQCPLVQMYFDQNSGEPSAENPWFNEVATHPFNVGYDFNHESPATKYFVKRVHSYWLTEFKVDGFRLDLSKGYTQNVTTDVSVWGQYDASRIAILEDYADHIWSVNPSAYMILEHFAENSEEKVLSAYGMMLWGNLNCNYNQSTMGYPSGPCSWDFSGISYQQRSWSDPHLVGYMESHDEERLMAKNTYYGNSSGDYNIKDTTIALQRIEQAACLFIPVPGPKMIWQFGELGYDYCINYPGAIGGSDHRLDNKPIRWDYENDYRRKVLFRVFSTLIHLKNTYNVFQTTDYSMNVSSAMKTVHLNDNSMNVTILGNFDVTPGNISPDFQHTGYWYDYFAGDSIMIDDVTANLNFMPGEFRLYTDVKLEKPEIGLGTSAEYFSDESNVLLFPNPVHNRFTIALNLEKRSDVVISLFGIDGKKLKTLANSNLGQGSQKLTFMTTMDDGSSLNPGFYLCEVTVNGKREILKLLIQ